MLKYQPEFQFPTMKQVIVKGIEKYPRQFVVNFRYHDQVEKEVIRITRILYQVKRVIDHLMPELDEEERVLILHEYVEKNRYLNNLCWEVEKLYLHGPMPYYMYTRGIPYEKRKMIDFYNQNKITREIPESIRIQYA